MKLPCDDEGYDHQGIVTNTDCTSNSTVDLHMYNGVIAGGVITAHSNGQMITFQLNHTVGVLYIQERGLWTWVFLTTNNKNERG